MILTLTFVDELDWLNDLAALPPEVRDAVLVLLDTLASQGPQTLHSEKTVYMPK